VNAAREKKKRLAYTGFFELSSSRGGEEFSPRKGFSAGRGGLHPEGAHVPNSLLKKRTGSEEVGEERISGAMEGEGEDLSPPHEGAGV